MSPKPGPAAPFDELRVHMDVGGTSLASDERLALLETLLEAGHPVTRGVASEHAPLALLSESEAGIAVAGVEPTEVLAQVTAKRESADQPAPGAWTPWFPVIDFARCTNCMQCLSFCLFDVYGVDEDGKITVRNEEKCKTSCPACSRVCPEVAILFPKYAKGPINGAEVKAEDITSESMKVDISALLGGDIYEALKDRSSAAKKRFSTERDESKALLERKRCLKELKDALDIPDEVLMTLPSAGDIEERTRRAKAKLEKRMERSQSEKDRKDDTGPAAPSVEEWDL
ncbi:MAG: NAD-dependent dihydropyrimidine dehydrogenase PreA subunit [Planctomycetota bacterium]|jgi:NAD-dependent dihydropyrimidine dehydrogenase PreA subunit